MSLKENDEYLERVREDFFDGTVARKRQLIEEMREYGLGQKSGVLIELLMKDRAGWLDEYGADETDVQVDNVGEYIVDITENGNPTEEGYDVREHKVYLPVTLQWYQPKKFDA